jgi:SAM-dependent methyltransferase
LATINLSITTLAWYHTFFNGLPQRAWKLNQSEEQTAFEADFLADVLELQPGDAVLDVLAGYGRHALQLAEQGFELTCVDISKEYCDELEAAVRENELPVTVLCEDALVYESADSQFKAAYCMGNSFSFFTYEQTQQFLSRLSASLVAGGKLVVHSEMLAESVLPNFQSRSWMPVGEDESILFLMNSDYDALEGCIKAELTYIEGEQRFSHFVNQYIYSLAELRRLFTAAGFTILETFSDIDGEPFRLGDEQVYILAQKD